MTIDKVRDNLHTVDVAILGDVTTNDNAARAHHFIQCAAEILEEVTDRDDILTACAALDNAIKALESVAEEYADMLIITRYHLEREVTP